MNKTSYNAALELATAISNGVNSFSFSAEDVCKVMTRKHRTLQQSFTKLCFAWIKHCAKDDYPHDERNRASHVKCAQIVKCMESDEAWSFLPMI